MLPVLVAIALCVAGVLVVRHVLAEHTFAELRAAVLAIPSRRLLAALLLTAASYAVLTGYDALALRVLKIPLSYPRTALASFVGYVFGHNVGLSVLGSGAARLRLYGSFGVEPPQVAWIVALCSVTFWLGLLALAGGTLAVAPEIVSTRLELHPMLTRSAGVLLVALVAGYVVLCSRRREPIRVRRWSMPMPTPPIAVAQVGLSFVDWTVAAGVLYALLPLDPSFSFTRFLSVFVSAQLVGVSTGVPGGLGTFEWTVQTLLAGECDETAALGALVAYRVVYYFGPFLLGALLFGVNEFVHRSETVKRVGGVVARAGTQIVPRALAIATFVAGAVLLFSSGTTPVEERAKWIRDVLPISILELSHFSASVVGMALLLFARGLYQRLHAAWLASVGLLAAGALFSLMKGLDWEEATLLTIVLVFLVRGRRHFTREASLVAQPFTRGWIAAVVVVLASTFVLARFTFKHAIYHGLPWWKVPFVDNVAIHGDAPRALRATVGAAVLALTFALGRLLRPAQPRVELAGRDELERALEIVRRSNDSTCNLALLGDKSFFWSASGKSFVAYAIQGRSWIALGDPIGDPAEANELLWRFHETVHHHGGRTVFYEVSGDRLPLYLDLGLILRKLGEEARVPVVDFSLEGRARKNLRRGVAKVEEAGGAFELVAPRDVEPLLPELERVSREWLASHGGIEKGFSLGFFDREYLLRFPVALVRVAGRIVAFANVWLHEDSTVLAGSSSSTSGAVGAATRRAAAPPSDVGAATRATAAPSDVAAASRPSLEELSIDLMRHTSDAPEGVMDFLFARLMQFARERGYRWFNLGMAPLSGLEVHPLAPLWHKVGGTLFRHGTKLYHFQGLRQYKEKFDPIWRPRYLAAQSNLSLPTVLRDVTSLVTRSPKLVRARREQATRRDSGRDELA